MQLQRYDYFSFCQVGGAAVKFRDSQLVKKIKKKLHSVNSNWSSVGEIYLGKTNGLPIGHLLIKTVWAAYQKP